VLSGRELGFPLPVTDERLERASCSHVPTSGKGITKQMRRNYFFSSVSNMIVVTSQFDLII
jgi:hypothetical protein